MASPSFGSIPYSTFTIEAAFFKMPKALIRGNGNRSVGPPMSKFCRDLDIENYCSVYFSREMTIATSVSGHPSTSPLERAVRQTYLFQPGNCSTTSNNVRTPKKSAIKRKRTISSVVLEKRLGCANLDVARTGRDILSTSRENIYYDEKNQLTVGHNRITITETKP
jgi:hypothetical protein